MPTVKFHLASRPGHDYTSLVFINSSPVEKKITIYVEGAPAEIILRPRGETYVAGEDLLAKSGAKPIYPHGRYGCWFDYDPAVGLERAVSIEGKISIAPVVSV